MASAALAFTCMSCAPQQHVVRERTLDADEVLRRVHERNSIIRTLSGSGFITVETREASTSGSFYVCLKKPDSLRVEFKGPFGIHVATLALSRDQFLFYNRKENTARVGKPDGTMLQSLFHLKMKFDEVLDAFAGEFPPADEYDTLSRFFVDKDLYVLVYRSEQVAKEYRVDGDGFLVSGYREFDAEGNPSLIAFTTRTTETSSITMPSLLRIVFPKERRSITIAYDDIQVNEPVNCSFTLPKHVEVLDQ